MNILICYWGRKGGGAKYSEELATNFSRLYPDSTSVSFSKNSEVFEAVRKLDAPCCHIETFNSVFSFCIRSFLLPFILFQLIRFVKKQKIDIVMTGMGHVWTPFGVLFLRLAGVKHVIVIHDAFPHPGDLKFYYQMNLITAKFSDKIIVLSEHVKNILIKNHNISETNIIKSTHGLLNYKGLKRDPKVFENSPFILVFFGRILEYKGISFLLEAFEYLEKKYDDIFLEIYGSGDLTSYRDQFSRLNRVKIVNRWIHDDEVENIFNKPCLNITPYIEASQSGIIPVACSCGIPTICTDVGGLSEQVLDGRTGIIIKGKDVCREIEESVEGLYNNRASCDLMSRNCSNYAQNTLEWEFICRRLYQDLENYYLN